MIEILAMLGGFFILLVLAALLAIAVDDFKARRGWRRNMDERMTMLERQMRYVPLDRRSKPEDADDKEGH